MKARRKTSLRKPQNLIKPYIFLELNFDYMKMIARFVTPKSTSDRLKRL